MNDIRPLRTLEDYDWAVCEVEKYFVSPPGPDTQEQDRFDILCDLIDAYDNKHHPLPEADPIDVIAAYMQEHGLKRRDLADIIGSKARATEVLERIRPLSLSMIQKIAASWIIPADLLIRPYHIDRQDVPDVPVGDAA
ncbi:XRE family transcriptional regulator [Rhizobium sp. FY34]|uniref:helix-turn-helix domain-containing protein n=1 Tax=Rhizobium sp. FY34 TaxID=2562309 RepID=UPI0010C0FDF3|nr:XRE family transcriptional regulator [Rhizobium sp. FY34]